MTLPELLSPAGSPEALDAALSAGADAVYLGGTRFNARMNAHNFDPPALREAVAHAHAAGARVYLTLNTLVWDRELPDAVAAAYEAAAAGVDALIIADLGAAAAIRAALPGLPLHASTQLSGHNARVGEVLAPFGFSRFVIARETSLADLAAAVENNPLEVEVFIHGALCVSHSGQCLFSSVVGGRSGNRGECAQPCRLPYGCGRKEGYPLSLKDLSLAAHVPALIGAGVSSLKIEGRMKSPGYVAGVTAIWRRLLDERRAATPDEMAALGDLFSRGGFTDGYQTGFVDRRMMGVRSEADKERSAAAERRALAEKSKGRLPLSMTLVARAGEPVTLRAAAPLYRQGGADPHAGDGRTPDAVSVTVRGDIPEPAAEGRGLSYELAERQLSRIGGTAYAPGDLTVDLPAGDGLSVPPSRLNALRREALEALDAARAAALPTPAAGYTPLSAADLRALPGEMATAAEVVLPARRSARRTARFRSAGQITEEAAAYFDRLYLPLGEAFPAMVPPEKRGYILPPVIFDREAAGVISALSEALSAGIRHLLVGNLGHLPLVREAAEAAGAAGVAGVAVTLHADHRLNPANAPAAARLLSLGFADLLLAPELTIPRMRDMGRALAEAGHEGATGAMVYGRLPLMLLEKCAIREIYADAKGPNGGAAVCRDICGRDGAHLTDRMGKSFPILREAGVSGAHRNSVYNSLPLSMSDRPDDLARAGLGEEHYLFSVESPREVDHVIAAYRAGRPLGGEVRRMVK